MVGLKKAEAIRTVGLGNSLTNQQIKDAVFKKFGLAVKSNQINGLLGPEYLRKNPEALKQLEDFARRFIASAGGLEEARRILSLAGLSNRDSPRTEGGMS